MNVYTTGRVPVKSWASEVEQKAIDQAINLSNLPFAISHVALMPDAHPGYGMPIGGVLFADKAIVPYAVGVDIGCGVALLRVRGEVDVAETVSEVARRVPVGNGPQAEHKTWEEWLPPCDGVSEVAVQAAQHACKQLGTLGGGNHFIEVQCDASRDYYVMLHSGSRSVGKKICDHWHKRALKLCETWHSDLPDRELAYLPWDTDEAHQYYRDMTFAMAWAEENRRRMLEQVQVALGADVDLIVDVHHNYAAFEQHRGRNGIVHRKGAVRARKNDVVLIPGSMGTASYVGLGLGNPDSFETCQHGAGRARSRTATVKLETEEHFAASMSGIILGGDAARARDESPFAYKSIEQVMADSADLVAPTMRLTPLGVVKG